jgi:pyruvate dehydrogenase E2 component (dihydrolipoamide acetyltransferase)
MAERSEVRVPDVGDADEVEVIEVLVAKGDAVAIDDPIVTLESDKATMELPSPVAGVVESVDVAVGDSVVEGTLLMVLTVEAQESSALADTAGTPAPVPEAASGSAADAPAVQASSAPSRAAAPARPPPPVPPSTLTPSSPPHASPLVRRMARELGVDLRGAEGSGSAGRILEEDVRATVRQAMQGGGARGAAAAAPSIDFSKYGAVEEVPLSKIRRVAARNLSRAWQQIPHVTQHDEADVTELEALRKLHAPRFKEEGVRISPLLFVLKACAIALRSFPNVRSSLAEGGTSLIVKNYYHLGVAVDTPNGLVVPVVRDVDRKGVRELAVEVADLAERARERKLRPADFEGAVFSISSLGGIGGTAFTPIVNAPQVAILGLSRTTVKPVWDGEAEIFVPRQLLPLSFSYDHRVIDGADAARFTSELARLLSNPSNLLL